MDTTSQEFKSVAHQMIDRLPSIATWDDLMYHLYVRQCVDAGLEDVKLNRVVDVDEIRSKFGLK